MRQRLLALLLTAAFDAARADTPVRSVQSVDLERYLGTWYEIARFPMFFQRHCLGDATALYQPASDGCIAITNRCRTESGLEEASGRACTVPGTGNAQLKVSFFWPLRSDYWIIGLDSDYRWAVVGNPNRKYLWILARSPRLPPAQLEQALQVASQQGYDLELLKYTPQSASE